MATRRKTLGGLSTNSRTSRAGGTVKASRRQSELPKKRSNKKGGTGRASLVPSGRRTSLSGRLSTGRNQQRRGSRGRQSISRQSMSRRSSVLGKGGSKISDPRPIGTKAYQQANILKLITYLTSNYYDRPTSPKLLTSPPSKDFRHILTFLFKQMDPNFEFGDSFEDEVKVLLKVFAYPFNISKSSLYAAGSPHTWPTMLAMLCWFIELLEYNEMGENNEESSLLDNDDGHKVFFDYTSLAYQSFLEGQDNFNVLDEDLAKNFEDRNLSVNEEIERLNKGNESLLTEVEALKNTKNEILGLQTKRANWLSDSQKFKTLIDQLETHQRGQEQQLVLLEQKSKEKTTELNSLTATRQALETQLEKQEFSPLEVQAMGHQKSMLDESLGGLAAQKEKIQREIWSQQMTNCKVQADLEKQVDKYNEAARTLEVWPATARNASGLNFEVILNPHASSALEMVNVDLKGIIKPALASLKSKQSGRVAEAAHTLRNTKERLQHTLETRNETAERSSGFEDRLKRLDVAYRAERETKEKEIKESVSQVEEAELQVHRLKSGKSLELEASKKELSATEEQIKDFSKLFETERETLKNEVIQVMEEVATHKVEIIKLLEMIEVRARDIKKGMQRAQVAASVMQEAMEELQ